MNSLLLLLALLSQAPAPRGNPENGKVLFTNQNPITYARFVVYIRKPTGEMPPYTAKVVNDQQAADLFAFLQSLPKPPAVESVPLLK